MLLFYEATTTTRQFLSFIFSPRKLASEACIFAIVKSKVHPASPLSVSNQSMTPHLSWFLTSMWTIIPSLLDAFPCLLDPKPSVMVSVISRSYPYQYFQQAIRGKYFPELRFSKLMQPYVGWNKFLCFFLFIEFKKTKCRSIFQRNVFLNNLIIIWIIEHSIRNAIFVDKLSCLFLSKQ